MLVKVENLKEGYELLEDVVGLSNKPIMRRKTILTSEHISVLKAFLIKEVHVNSVPNPTFKKVAEREVAREEVIIEHKSNSIFKKEYVMAVQSYKKEFQYWQSGIPVDISKIRKIILPLIDLLDKNSFELLVLHKYVTKSDYIYHHSIATALLSSYIAKTLNISSGERLQIALAGCLCDSGLSKIDPFILHKSVLTDKDRKEYKTHPIHSYKMIQNIPSLKNETKLAVLQHHEKIDGTGYPLGDKEQKLHLYSKIISVAESYHENICTSDQPTSPFKVLDEMRKDYFGKFDVKILNAFTSLITQASIGVRVKLSNQLVGEIVFIHNHDQTRPLIKIIETNQIINLIENKSINIDDILI